MFVGKQFFLNCLGLVMTNLAAVLMSSCEFLYVVSSLSVKPPPPPNVSYLYTQTNRMIHMLKTEQDILHVIKDDSEMMAVIKTAMKLELQQLGLCGICEVENLGCAA